MIFLCRLLTKVFFFVLYAFVCFGWLLFVGETIYTPVLKRYLVSGNKSKYTGFQLAGNPLRSVKMLATSGVIVREFIRVLSSISGSVEKLEIGACNIDDAMFSDVVAAIQKHNVLRELNLEHNSISSLDKLKNLGAAIKYLDFSYNRLKSISRHDFQSVINLEKLLLAGNKLQDASGLENLIHLAELNLDNNQITNITGLKNLKNLARVRLDINRITNLDVFAIDKTKLKVLILTNNDITDISPLGNLINLQHLEINQNKVSNISSLYHLRQLSAVLLGGNSPLINKTDIVKLQDVLGPPFGCETYVKDVCVAQPTSCRNCIFCQGTKSNDQFHFNPNNC